jgi:hypothetical protein
MAMKVEGPGGPNRVQPRKIEGAKKAGNPVEFAVAGLGSILAAQAVDPDTGEAPSYEERRRRARRGEEILERLEEIRRGFLLGTIPKDRLATLAREKRERGADPLISQLLDEIELRAEVELAKLSRL